MTDAPIHGRLPDGSLCRLEPVGAKITGLPCQLCKQQRGIDSVLMCDPCWVEMCNRNAAQVAELAALRADRRFAREHETLMSEPTQFAGITVLVNPSLPHVLLPVAANGAGYCKVPLAVPSGRAFFAQFIWSGGCGVTLCASDGLSGVMP